VRALFIGISECTKRNIFFVGNIIKTRLLKRGPNGLDAAFSTFVFFQKYGTLFLGLNDCNTLFLN
jgi:hypothetical protein